MRQLLSAGANMGVGSAHYNHIIIIAQEGKQLTLGKMENGAKIVTWK